MFFQADVKAALDAATAAPASNSTSTADAPKAASLLEESVVLQVNGAPVLVNPETMLKVDTEARTNLGLVDMVVGMDELSVAQKKQLKGPEEGMELETMQKNELFYLDLKKRLEAENEELVVENSNLEVLKDSISLELQDTKEQLSHRDYEYDSLKAKFLETEEELAALISLEQEAQSEDILIDANPSDLYIPLIPQEFIDQIKEWAHQYSTLAFPCEVKVMDEPVTLSDLELKANVEIQVGEILVVTRFHPVSEEYVVARQGDSDTFMASVHVNNTDILEVLAEKFVNHMKDMGKKVSNPFMSNRFSQIDKNFSEEN